MPKIAINYTNKNAINKNNLPNVLDYMSKIQKQNKFTITTNELKQLVAWMKKKKIEDVSLFECKTYFDRILKSYKYNLELFKERTQTLFSNHRNLYDDESMSYNLFDYLFNTSNIDLTAQHSLDKLENLVFKDQDILNAFYNLYVLTDKMLPGMKLIKDSFNSLNLVNEMPTLELKNNDNYRNVATNGTFDLIVASNNSQVTVGPERLINSNATYDFVLQKFFVLLDLLQSVSNLAINGYVNDDESIPTDFSHLLYTLYQKDHISLEQFYKTHTGIDNNIALDVDDTNKEIKWVFTSDKKTLKTFIKTLTEASFQMGYDLPTANRRALEKAIQIKNPSNITNYYEMWYANALNFGMEIATEFGKTGGKRSSSSNNSKVEPHAADVRFGNASTQNTLLTRMNLGERYKSIHYYVGPIRLYKNFEEYQTLRKVDFTLSLFPMEFSETHRSGYYLDNENNQYDRTYDSLAENKNIIRKRYDAINNGLDKSVNYHDTTKPADKTNMYAKAQYAMFIAALAQYVGSNKDKTELFKNIDESENNYISNIGSKFKDTPVFSNILALYNYNDKKQSDFKINNVTQDSIRQSDAINTADFQKDETLLKEQYEENMNRLKSMHQTFGIKPELFNNSKGMTYLSQLPMKIIITK